MSIKFTIITATLMFLLSSTGVISTLPHNVYNFPPVDVEAIPALSVTNPVPVNTMNDVTETWADYEETGHALTKLNTKSLLSRALASGTFVGIGGVLTASVGFDMGQAPWLPGNGFPRFMSGAIGFPLTILLVAVTGQGAWTGDISLVTRAFFKDSKKTSVLDYSRFFTLMWCGCFIGTALVAGLATVAKLPACKPSLDIALHKLDYGFMETLARAIGGGFLINLAVFMARANRDMVGKALAVWFPISTYVICDFEHVLASMYFLLTGKWNGASYSYGNIIKLLIPSTIGNLIGAFLVSCGIGSIPKDNR